IEPAGSARGLAAHLFEIDALVGGAAVQTQIQVLVVVVVVVLLHRAHHLLGHAHGEGQVAAHLPDHHGGADVASLNLHVLSGNLFDDAQGVGAVALAAVLGAVGEGGGELVRLGVIHLLVHALLEVLEDDCQLQTTRRKKKAVTRRSFSEQVLRCRIFHTKSRTGL
uniref:Uncharacterized protein n=1 Tax=Hippocampus comes TaxID=109280 RepID=A0A3Q2YUL7_HIPCM